MFGFHPANLAFRFGLEVAALVAIGVGAHRLGSGLMAWVLGVGAAAVAAVAWGVFNVPGDDSRSGQAPVPVPGAARIVVELAVFTTAVALLAPVSVVAAALLAVAVAVHYLLSLDRIRWLLRR